MKTIYLVIVSLMLLGSLGFAQPVDGSVDGSNVGFQFNSNEEITEMVNGMLPYYYTSLASLDLRGTVTDLSPLNTITKIGELNIMCDGFCSGLNNVQTIESRLFIRSDFNGLNGLTSINPSGNSYGNPGGVWIWGNVTGLSNLSYINGGPPDGSGYGGIFINRFFGGVDSNITNIPAFENLTTLIGDIYINQTHINSITGFNNLQTSNSLHITNNPNLTSINAFSNLHSINTHLEIGDNPNLQTIGGFGSLTNVTDYGFYRNGGQHLPNTPLLTNISHKLAIQENPSLVDLSGLNGLTSISFNGLSSNDNEFLLEDNGALTNVADLSNLTTVNTLVIGGCASLANLSGLNNLTFLYNFVLGNNAALTSLAGLSYNVGDTIYYLNITNNPQLTTCAVKSVCDALQSTFVYFNNNGANCNSNGEVANICNNVPPTLQIVCSGAKVSSLIPTGTGLKWYLVATGGTALTATTLLTTRTYYASQTTDGIESTTRSEVAVTVNPKSVAGSISGAGTICSDSAKTLILSASHVGTVQWQSSTTSSTTGFSNIDGATGNTYTTPALNTTTYYKAIVTNGVCSSVPTAAVTVVVSPPAVPGTINGGDVTVCAYSAGAKDLSGTIVPFTNSTPLTLDGSSGTILWQKSTNYTATTPTWVLAGSTSNSFTATNLTTDTWYRAKVTSGACKPPSDVVKITVTKIAKAGTVTATTNGVVTTSVCTGGDITFNSGAYIGDTIQWEYTEDDPPSATNPTPQTWIELTEGKKGLNAVNVSKARFYYRAKYTSGTCTMAYSAVKTITVNAVTVAGRISVGGGPVCQGGAGKVTVTGQIGKVQWQYSTDGSDYFNVPIATNDTVTEFDTTSSSGISSSYLITNIQNSVYFRAMIKNGQCNTEYTDPVQYVLGATAAAGTISSTVSGSLCNGTGTALMLENYTGNTIQWYRGLKRTTEPVEWIVVPGATKPRLTTGNLTASYDYKAVVSIANGISVCSGLDGAVYATTSVDVLPKALAKTIKPVGFDNTIAADITNVTRVIKMDAGYIADTFQWQKAPVGDTAPVSTSILWTNIDGATTDSYVLDSPVEGTNWFRLKVVKGVGCLPVNSSPIRVKWSRTNGVDKLVVSQVEPEVPFIVVAYPNPYSEGFNLRLTTSSDAKVGIMVYDMLGKILEQREVRPNEVPELHIGDRFPTGIYNIIINQGVEVKTLRVIKK